MGFLSSVFKSVAPVAGSILGGPVGGAIGSGISSAFTAREVSAGAERANQQNIDLSNTAYQRGMADMKKAGLNPILAGKYGGASTPMMQNTVLPGVTSALQSKQTDSSVNLQSQQARQVSVQVDKTAQEISNLAATKNLTETQTKNVAATLELIKAQAAHEILKHKKTIADTSGQEQLNIMKSIATEFIRNAKIPQTTGTVGTVVQKILNTSEKGYKGLFNLDKYGVSLENTKLVIQQLMREYFRGNGS